MYILGISNCWCGWLGQGVLRPLFLGDVAQRATVPAARPRHQGRGGDGDDALVPVRAHDLVS